MAGWLAGWVFRNNFLSFFLGFGAVRECLSFAYWMVLLPIGGCEYV